MQEKYEFLVENSSINVLQLQWHLHYNEEEKKHRKSHVRSFVDWDLNWTEKMLIWSSLFKLSLSLSLDSPEWKLWTKKFRFSLVLTKKDSQRIQDWDCDESLSFHRFARDFAFQIATFGIVNFNVWKDQFSPSNVDGNRQSLQSQGLIVTDMNHG